MVAHNNSTSNTYHSATNKNGVSTPTTLSVKGGNTESSFVFTSLTATESSSYSELSSASRTSIHSLSISSEKSALETSITMNFGSRASTADSSRLLFITEKAKHFIYRDKW